MIKKTRERERRRRWRGVGGSFFYGYKERAVVDGLWGKLGAVMIFRTVLEFVCVCG